MPVSQQDHDGILAQTGGIWEKLRGQRIFLTGGTGFFGCWLLESFLHANRSLRLGASISALTRSPERFRQRAPHLAGDPAIEFVAGDIRSFPFPSGNFEYVIHAAADTSAAAAEHPIELFTSIVDGTRHVLDFAASHGTRQLLFVSSGAVYGTQDPAVSHISESSLGGPDWLRPQAAYGEGKRAAELMCALHARDTGIACKIARCFAFVGPYLPLNAHFAVGNFIRDAMNGLPVRIHGDGTPMRSYLYAADLAAWLWTLLLHGKSGEAYNVGSDQALSILDLAKAVEAALETTLEIQIARPPVAGEPRTQYVPCVDKAKRDLGLKVSVDLHEAIRRTAAWHGFRR